MPTHPPPIAASFALGTEFRALIAGSRKWSTPIGPLFAHPTLPIFPECNFVQVTQAPSHWEGEMGLSPLLDANHIPHLRLLFLGEVASAALAQSLAREGFEHRRLEVLWRDTALKGLGQAQDVWPAKGDLGAGDAILGEALEEPLYQALLAHRRAELSEEIGLKWVYAGDGSGHVPLATGAYGLLGEGATIQWVRVREGHQRRGLGRRIVLGCLRMLDDLGATQVSVLIDADNKGAAALYRGLDFRGVGEMEVWERYR